MRQWMNGFLLTSLFAFALPAHAGLIPTGLPDVQARIKYMLPETDEFRGFGSFDLAIEQAGFDGENLEVRYEVPPDLIGKNARFMTMSGKLSEDGQSLDLFCGETGSTAQCSVDGQSLSCSIRFRNLTPDAAEVDAFLTRKYGRNDPHLPARKFASRIFGIDAIGTLAIDLLD